MRIPNTLHYLKGIQSGALLAADLATYVTAFGREAGFRKVEALAAWRRTTFGRIEQEIERVRAELLAAAPAGCGVDPGA